MHTLNEATVRSRTRTSRSPTTHPLPNGSDPLTPPRGAAAGNALRRGERSSLREAPARAAGLKEIGSAAQRVGKAHGGEAEGKPEGLPEMVARDEEGVACAPSSGDGLRQKGGSDRSEDEIGDAPGGDLQ